MKQKHIAILDFGSQYMHLISRRIRQLGVFAKIYPTDVNAHELKDAWGIVISGGPNSVNDQKLPYDPGIFDLPVPILGLCYGHQLMAHQYNGIVTPAHNREYGKARFEILQENPLFEWVKNNEQVWMSHWDSVTEAPEGFTVIGKTTDCPVAAMANVEAKRYGLQFHPEVHHTTQGMAILKNFVFEICEAQVNWSMEEYLEQLSQEITDIVKEKNVFLFVSGGVDSAVAFALLEHILGKDRVFGLHVDNGFMRKNESALVHDALAEAGFDNLHVVNESDRFLLAVEKMSEPEEKRRTIGRVFLDVQHDAFTDLNLDPGKWILGQGTIYPDTIESGGTKASDLIKTHHNRVPEIMEMIKAGTVIEPLAELYKDEVRTLGKKLGLPDELLRRWPFPGPGLSIRCLCSDGEKVAIENEESLNSELALLTASIGCSGVVLPVRSVGVQGDLRSYQHPALVYGPTAVSWDLLHDLSVKITNALHGVNRVVYHVGGEIDLTRMRLTKAYLTKERLDVLREVDAIVDYRIRQSGVYDAIWQFPIILLPLTFGKGETVVLRPIESQEAMTVNAYPLDRDVLQSIVNDILKLGTIDAVFFDITNKPPATIEWE